MLRGCLENEAKTTRPGEPGRGQQRSRYTGAERGRIVVFWVVLGRLCRAGSAPVGSWSGGSGASFACFAIRFSAQKASLSGRYLLAALRSGGFCLVLLLSSRLTLNVWVFLRWYTRLLVAAYYGGFFETSCPGGPLRRPLFLIILSSDPLFMNDTGGFSVKGPPPISRGAP